MRIEIGTTGKAVKVARSLHHSKVILSLEQKLPEAALDLELEPAEALVVAKAIEETARRCRGYRNE